MFAGFDSASTEFIDCGSGHPHGQHTVCEENGVTYLCEGKSQSDYVHCGEPGYHPQHRTGPNEDGPYCLGVMSTEERVQHFKLPVARLTTHDLMSLLQGETISVPDDEGRMVFLAKHTPDTLLEAHDKARATETNPDLLPPRMTYADAVRLTKGL